MKPKKLSDFKVKEVSFVKRGANKKKVFLTKNHKESKFMKNLISRLENFQFEDEKAIDKQLEVMQKADNMKSGTVEALKGAMALLQIAKEDLDTGMSMSIDGNGAYATIRKSDEIITKSESEESLKVLKSSHEKEISDLNKSNDERIVKAKDLVTDESKENFDRIFKDEPIVSVNISKEAQEQINKQAEKIEALTEKIEKAEDVKLTSEFITKAEKDFSTLGKADDVGYILKAASKSLDSSDFEKLETILKSAEAQLTGAKDITKELGSDAHDESGDPEVKVQKLAEKFSKENNVSIEKARMVIRKQIRDNQSNGEA